SLSAATPIISGTTATEGAFPFLVSLSNNGKHFCGGSLLNANTVLTAAHCSVFQSVTNARVRAGSLSHANHRGTRDWTSGGVEVGISSILVNRNYGLSSKNNDVALWYLDTPIQAGADIAYATLPAAGSDPEAGTTVTVA
ncbi:trypsin-like cysteine/serine peptidase domain-containing protein, partial [Microdochium bolleyi]